MITMETNKFKKARQILLFFDLPFPRRLPNTSARVFSFIAYILNNMAKPTECLHKYDFIPFGQVQELSGETI